MTLSRLVPVTLSALALLAPAARADLPEAAFGPVFERFCDDLKKVADCSDCTCSPITSSSASRDTLGADPDFAHAILVKLETPAGVSPGKVRFHLAIGSDSRLTNGGEFFRGDFTDEAPRYVDIEVKKAEQVLDVCLKCDHENAGLVHLFDVVLKSNQASQSEDYAFWEEHEHISVLLTCMKETQPNCFGTLLGSSSQRIRPPMAPGDKGEKGKKETTSRTWKLGGRNKLQIVLSPFTGHKAKDINAMVKSEPSSFNFMDLPQRAKSGVVTLPVPPVGK